MKVYDEHKLQVLTEYDLTKGYLKNDTITKHIPAAEAVQEQSHFETVKEYPNGGKDVKKVIDVEGREAVPEHDETEEIQVYIPYTAAQLQKRVSEKRIAELKRLLATTDYKAIKYAEGEMTASEYYETKTQRKAWRAEINALEAQLN